MFDDDGERRRSPRFKRRHRADDVTGSRTSVSVPDNLASVRAWKHDDSLLQYPAEPGPVLGQVRLRFLEKRWELDLTFPVNDATVGWSFAAQRAAVDALPEFVAKSFCVEGSRFFLPLTQGVATRETPEEAVATTVVKIDRPLVEMGLQTADMHEYFLSKGEALVGQLIVERDQSLGDKYPWLATIIDSQIVPNAALKGAPMPPDGVSGLPVSIEKVVPAPFRYWECRGEEALTRRDALAASGFLGAGTLAMVDGEMGRVVTKYELYEGHDEEPLSPAEWRVAKVAELLPDGARLVEVNCCATFSPGPAAIAKAGADRVIYVDAGAATGNVLELLAKALSAHPGHYVVTAQDSGAARAGLAPFGRPFYFRPGAGVGVDAVKRLFVASFGVRSDGVCWLDKELDDSAAKWLRRTPQVKATALDVARERRAFRTSSGKPVDDESMALSHRLSSGSKPLPIESEAHRGVSATYSANAEKTPEAHVAAAATHRDIAQRLRDHKGYDLDIARADAAHHEEMAAKHEAVAAKGGGSVTDYVRDEQGRFAFKAIKILKADDEHFVLGVVLEPDEVDAQKDVYSADEVRQAAHRYMAEFQNRGHMHKELVNSKVDILESYVAPVDFAIGKETVKKGTWIMAVRVKDATLWTAVKGGALTGFSIGGSANRQADPKATSKYNARKIEAKKKIAFQGIPIVIDRPRGTVQHGVGDDGQPWERTYQVDYGYIPQTKGGDGEGLDVFVGPKDDSPAAYWITQKNGDGDFDEYKLLLGFDSAAEARKVYEQHVPPQFFADMSEGSVHQIKALLNQHPEQSLAKALGAFSEAEGCSKKKIGRVNEALKFDDGEARDDAGKWTGDGGAEIAAPPKNTEEAEKYFRADKDRLERVVYYTRLGYEQTNEYLRDPVKYQANTTRAWGKERGRKDAAENRVTAQALLKDLNNAPKSEGVICRGLVLPGADLDKLIPGATYRARTFLSASSSEERAQRFADSYSGALDRGDGNPNEERLGRVMLHLKQTTGVSVAGISRFPEEKEVIVRPGVRFKVDRVTTRQNEGNQKVTHVYMTETRTRKGIEDEPRDEGGKWTGGGGGGVGAGTAQSTGERVGSGAENVRAMKEREIYEPEANAKILEQVFPNARVEGLEQAFSGGELTARLTSLAGSETPGGAQFAVGGKLLDAKGKYQGNFGTTFTRDKDGIHAQHDSLFLEDAAQGKGSGSAILKSTLAFEKAHGVDRVGVSAMAVGKYTWAALGVQWSKADGQECRGRLEDYLVGNTGLERSAARKIAREVSPDASKVADLHVDEKHVGKGFLLSGSMPSWHGTLNLKDGDAGYERVKARLR